MADGKVSFAYSRFLGLDKDKETGKIVVNPEQAETVKLIFHLFLEGMTPHSIAMELTNRGIKTPGGKDVWNQQTVRRMLSNEKYKGDTILQKEFTVDFFTEEDEEKRGRSSTTLCGGKPRGYHQSTGFQFGTGGACQTEERRFTV